MLSGRLVPMPLMPRWVQQLAFFLPFQWTLYFPIEALVGTSPPQQLFIGLGMQLLWILVGLAAGCAHGLAHSAIKTAISAGGELRWSAAMITLSNVCSGAYLRIGISNELQYRVNFFIQILQSLIALAVGLIGLALVFNHTTDLDGWSQPELLAVMGVTS